MLINLPSKLFHGIEMIFFAAVDKNEDNKPEDWIIGGILDLLIFGYFWYVTRCYRIYKAREESGEIQMK